MKWIIVIAALFVIGFAFKTLAPAKKKPGRKTVSRRAVETPRINETLIEKTESPGYPTTKAPEPTELEQLKFRRKGFFFTRTESAFYRNLVEATKDSHIVLSKTRIADLIEPDYKPFTKEHGKAFNQISRKHVDFVLIDKEKLTIHSAIELDGPSHQKESQQKSDKVKDYVFNATGLPLFRFKNGTDFSPEKLKEALGLKLPEEVLNTNIPDQEQKLSEPAKNKA